MITGVRGAGTQRGPKPRGKGKAHTASIKMGNKLVCGDSGVAALGVVDTSQGVYNCSGTVRGTGGECVFGATYALANGTDITVDSCLSYYDAPPPGFQVALADNIRLSEFWCPTADFLDQRVPAALLNVTTCECLESVGGDAEDSAEDEGQWVLGVAFSILSSASTTVGTLLQKYAHNLNDAKEHKAREFLGLLLSPMWLLALFVMVLLPLPFDFLAFSMAPQSLLVPFAGMTILLNAILAPLTLGEKITRVEIVATFVILVGLVLTTAFGPKDDVDLSACELLDRYDDADMLVMLLSTFALIGTALYFIHLAPQTATVKRATPALYALCAGGFGGIMNIFFKAVGEMAASGVSADAGASDGLWKSIHPYYHIVLIVVLATLQISFINQGLRRYSAVLFSPLYNSLYIACSATFGAIMFKEFAGYTPVQFVFFPLGILVTLLGISLMTLKTPGSEHSEVVVPDPEALASHKSRQQAPILAIS